MAPRHGPAEPRSARLPDRILRIGYVPLTDAAPLVVAEALGLFRQHGVRVALSEESAWAAVRARAAAGRPPVRLAAVFPFSSHHYLLRHWLASGGLDPDRDLRLMVVPPPRTARALAEGAIDGFFFG